MEETKWLTKGDHSFGTNGENRSQDLPGHRLHILLLMIKWWGVGARRPSVAHREGAREADLPARVLSCSCGSGCQHKGKRPRERARRRLGSPSKAPQGFS
ncbi:hypothetical protein NDU88_011966 [Pleurodeles waltl]|uniref:Uncharacterized protein n=1 Tax=Pleurodeles waltl TaxID=8319 RepID=A0AAV7QZC9_PLEWA|nr:hypothetical protein NDU88_011966 [Pleurodeles waltl]